MIHPKTIALAIALTGFCLAVAVLSGCSTTQQAQAAKAVSTYQSYVAKAQAAYPAAAAAVNTYAPIVTGTATAAKISNDEIYVQTALNDAALFGDLLGGVLPVLSGTASPSPAP